MSSLARFPFSAVVGQSEARLALLLAAVDPGIGGVLLRGDKGSAKSTLARGLAGMLPGGAPFVELPLGATEDRVLGTLDVLAGGAEAARGEAPFRPGLLARANGGVLYVDEVNLLPDHLVDMLLDVAESGLNRVEREGLSHSHPARFVLVGSMNPEEGELRPQLLDRFGLSVEIKAPTDPLERAEVVRRRLTHDAGGRVGGAEGDIVLRARLAAAMPADLPDTVVDFACRLAVGVGAEGLRADLVLCRAAAAFAGWEGRSVARSSDVERVAPLALGHRRRRRPFDPPVMSTPDLERALAAARQSFADAYPQPEPAAPPSPPPTAADAAAAFDAAAPGETAGSAVAGDVPRYTDGPIRFAPPQAAAGAGGPAGTGASGTAPGEDDAAPAGEAAIEPGHGDTGVDEETAHAGDAPAGFAPAQPAGGPWPGSPPPDGPAPVLPGAGQPDQDGAATGTVTTADDAPVEAPPGDPDRAEHEDPFAAGTGEDDGAAAGTGGHDGAPSPGPSGPEGGDDADDDSGRAVRDEDAASPGRTGDGPGRSEDGPGRHEGGGVDDSAGRRGRTATGGRADQHDGPGTGDQADQHDDPGTGDRADQHDGPGTGDRADESDDRGRDGAVVAPSPGAPTASPDPAASARGDAGGTGPSGSAPPLGGPWQSLSGGAFNAPPATFGEAPPPSFDPGPAPHDRPAAPVRTAEPDGSADTRTATEAATAGTVLAAAAGRAAAQWRQDGVDTAAAVATAESSAPTSGSAHARTVGRTVVVAVDASGSSGTHKRVEAATGAVLGLLGDAYLRRDRVAMVTFRGDTAEVVLPPTASLETARARLAELPTGGVTPLAEGINAGLALARRAESDGWPALLVLVTDGRATGNQSARERAVAAAAAVAAAQIDVMVIDPRGGSNGAGQAGQLAEAMGARCHRLDDLTPAAVEAAVREALR